MKKLLNTVDVFEIEDDEILSAHYEETLSALVNAVRQGFDTCIVINSDYGIDRYEDLEDEYHDTDEIIEDLINAYADKNGYNLYFHTDGNAYILEQYGGYIRGHMSVTSIVFIKEEK